MSLATFFVTQHMEIFAYIFTITVLLVQTNMLQKVLDDMGFLRLKQI